MNRFPTTAGIVISWATKVLATRPTCCIDKPSATSPSPLTLYAIAVLRVTLMASMAVATSPATATLRNCSVCDPAVRNTGGET